MRYFRQHNPTNPTHICYVILGNVSKYKIKNIGHQVRKGDNGDPIFIWGYCQKYMFCAYITSYPAITSYDFLKIKVCCVQFIVYSRCKIKNSGHQLQNEDMTPFMGTSLQFYIEIMYIIDMWDLKNV